MAGSTGGAEEPRYVAAVREGFQEFFEGNWERSNAAFRKAYAVFPNAHTHRGIGMTAAKAGDLMRLRVSAPRH